ncbi:unnamed protein product [Sphagnum troendelagicum]|jgi:hypothetical protein|uniref:Uncharacterized protein n=1 Tax=Sphagnum jensenii TaxID=128206 RepID=A0ABP1BUT4_9BRYO
MVPATANKTARIVCDCRCPDSAIAVLQRLLVRKLVEKKEGGGGEKTTDNNRLPSLPLQRAIVGRQVISYHFLTGLLK